MKARYALFAVAALWLGSIAAAAAQQAAPAVPDRLAVTIDTQQTMPAVTKYEYGQFIEHIGSTMYGSLWAEMLDDRKFYFPITSKSPKRPAGQQGGPFRMHPQMEAGRSRRGRGDGQGQSVCRRSEPAH